MKDRVRVVNGHTATGYVMTGLVIMTMLVAVRSVVTLENGVVRTAAALWLALGVVVLWLRWRPRN